MSRYLGPKKKLILRLGLLNGFNNSLKYLKKKKEKKKPSFFLNKIYSQVLIKFQKIRHLYGLTRTQLEKIIKKPQLILYKFLEQRLDCMLFRLGFANTIATARQLISHKHIYVNGVPVTFPSYSCKKNDIIFTSKTSFFHLNLIKTVEEVQQQKFSQLKSSKIFESEGSTNILGTLKRIKLQANFK